MFLKPSFKSSWQLMFGLVWLKAVWLMPLAFKFTF